MYIFDSGVYNRNPNEVSGRINKMIEDAGGEVLVSRLWEERRLAYPIQGQRRGTYWLTYFKIDSEKLAHLNRQSQLNGNILRFLYLKIDARLIDTLVEHAKMGQSKPETSEKIEESESSDSEESQKASS
jgi:small subunit ribosomal protein S6